MRFRWWFSFSRNLWLGHWTPHDWSNTNLRLFSVEIPRVWHQSAFLEICGKPADKFWCPQRFKMRTKTVAVRKDMVMFLAPLVWTTTCCLYKRVEEHDKVNWGTWLEKAWSYYKCANRQHSSYCKLFSDCRMHPIYIPFVLFIAERNDVTFLAFLWNWILFSLWCSLGLQLKGSYHHHQNRESAHRHLLIMRCWVSCLKQTPTLASL